MKSNPERVLYLKHTLELALVASCEENIDYVYPYALFIISWNASENQITQRESVYLKHSLETYYNKLKKFESLARDIDRSLIV